MKKLLFIVALVICQPVFGQSTYNFIQENWQQGQVNKVASLTSEDLHIENLSDDELAYALLLVTRANIRVNNIENANRVIETINTNMITIESLFWDVWLQKARIANKSGDVYRADWLYSVIIPALPQDRHELIASNYNNWSLIKYTLTDVEGYYALADSALFHNELSTHSRKQKLQNTIYSNLSESFYDTDLDQAEFWHDQIDTTDATVEMNISYYISKGQIEMRQGHYEESLASFDIANQLASMYEIYTLRDQAIKGAFSAKSLQEKYFKERRNRIIGGFLVGLALFIGWFIYRRIEDKMTKNEADKSFESLISY
jgi:hypothetical protein